MGTTADRIVELEEELRTTKYNKATSFHIGLVKAKIARLKADNEVQVRKASGRSGPAYSVKKHGDATALLVGYPSVGKSTLLNKLTRAESKVAAYAFTTLTVIPGMMEYRGAKIQILDIPGIITGAARGRGRGKEVLAVVRNADLVLLMIDAPGQLRVLKEELYQANLRLNDAPPDISIKNKSVGGLHIVISARLSQLDENMVKAMLQEYGVHNSDVVVRQDLSVDQLVDVLSENRKYVPAITIINKADAMSAREIDALRQEAPDALLISADKGTNLEQLREEIASKLGFIRIYMKKIGSAPDLDEPLILKKDHTITGACARIHKEWVGQLHYARVWGRSSRFGGQVVGKEHSLQDGDIIELHFKR
jgi:small GTP-binding protein